MVCWNCKSELRDGLTMCPFCGTPLDEESRSMATAYDKNLNDKMTKMNLGKKKKVLIVGTVCAFLAVVLIVLIGIAIAFSDKKSGGKDNGNTDATAQTIADAGKKNGTSVHVKVQDDSGNVLQAARVQIYEFNDETVLQEAATDENGVADFTLDGTDYIVYAFLEGYDDANTELHMQSNGVNSDYNTVMKLAKLPATVTVQTIVATTEETAEDVEVSVKSSTGQEVYNVSTGRAGYYEIENVPNGEYTLIFEKDGFHTMQKTIEVTDSMKVVQPMVPIIDDKNAVLVFMEWEGDQDLDLCLFNSSEKRYVSIAYSTDSDGNFLYSDHDSDKKYECLYLRNKQLDYAQSIFVVDTEKAQLVESSTMERDGLVVTFYNQDSAVEYYPKCDQTAPVWFVAYYYDGNRYDPDDNEYMTESSAIAWTRKIK